jgi:Transglutaminase-like superfamily
MRKSMNISSALPRPIDPRKLSPAKSSEYLSTALDRARILAEADPNVEAIITPFAELLKFVVESKYCGGCHDTSAVLHVLLAEAGVESTLCIGEVGVGNLFFDHSWIEVRGRAFDVAVCMPHEDGEPVSGPVFGNVDLITGASTALRYGAASGQGIGDAAQPALLLNLEGYSAVQPDPNIWVLSVAMASRCGNERATFSDFRDRYGSVRRSLRA